MAVTEAEFNDRVDETFEALEEALDQVDGDLDYETGGGVLTVQFENGTTMVFSRQPPTSQLWVASRSGGYHFTWDNELEDWRDTRSEALFRPFVAGEMQTQAGVELAWG